MLFRSSGGLIYHLRALRSKSAWAEFRRSVEAWLGEWTSGENSELILIGPSGGYTLTDAWLTEFKHVYAYDFDPLAPLFFKLTHPKTKVSFQRPNLFWSGGRLSLQPLIQVLKAHPRAKILFSNILGQVLLEGKATETEWREFLTRLRATLEGRQWASYHDLFTHENGHVIDHLTQGSWTDSLPRRQFEWLLTPKSRHVIEGVHSI